MLIGSGWVCLSCLFHVELSVALPSGITCCFLSCPPWPERASLTLPLKGVPGGDSAGSAVPGSGSAAGKAEKLSTVLQILCVSSRAGVFLLFWWLYQESRLGKVPGW